jgi:hypothetical protein
MKSKSLLPLLLLGTCALSHALTDEGKKAADELISALKEESRVIDEADPESGRSQSSKMLLRQVQTALGKGNDFYLEQMLDNLDGKPARRKGERLPRKTERGAEKQPRPADAANHRPPGRAGEKHLREMPRRHLSPRSSTD